MAYLAAISIERNDDLPHVILYRAVWDVFPLCDVIDVCDLAQGTH